MDINGLKERLNYINNILESGYIYSPFENELKIEREEIERFFKNLGIEY